MPRYLTRVQFLDGTSATYTVIERKTLCAGRVIELVENHTDSTWLNMAAVQSISFDAMDGTPVLSGAEIATLLGKDV